MSKDFVCRYCGKKAVVREMDIFYECAKCWLKKNKPEKDGKK